MIFTCTLTRLNVHVHSLLHGNITVFNLAKHSGNSINAIVGRITSNGLVRNDDNDDFEGDTDDNAISDDDNK